MPLAIAAASSGVAIALLWPGIVFTFAASASFFDAILSPMASMAWAFGPMKTIPSFSSAAQNAGFSDRKPYPGWTASAPVSWHAFTMRSMTR